MFLFLFSPSYISLPPPSHLTFLSPFADSKLTNPPQPLQTLTPTTLLYTSCPPTGTSSPNNNPNNPNQNNNSPAPAPPAATQTAVYTQTVTDKNGAQVTVTGTGANSQKNGGVAAPTGGAGAGGGNNGGNGNGTLFTGAAGQARGVKEGVVLMGLAGLVVLVL